MKVDLASFTFPVRDMKFFEVGEKSKFFQICTVNSEFVLLANKDREFLEVLRSSYCSVDGMLLYWILKFRFRMDVKKLSGSDILPHLESHPIQGARIYLLGGVTEACESAKKKLRTAGYLVDGFSGILDAESEGSVVDKICLFAPDFLFVGLGAPKQEMFISRNRSRLTRSVTFAIGCGGAIDMFGGKFRRAPKWIQKMGFESVYRTFQDPTKERLYRFIKVFEIIRYFR